MCATCGCGESDVEVGHARHPHEHDHIHAHEHGHEHSHIHGHEHPHEHSHHDEVHGHGAHEHSHGNGHPHDHVHSSEQGPARGDAQTRRDPGQGRAASRESRQVSLEQSLLARNQQLAERNRGWFLGREVLAVNLMSAPGSGKTTLLARTVREHLGQSGAVSELLVVEGDQATQHDAERIRAAGARALQINTGTGCHLDADMIWRALIQLQPPIGSLLLIENIGNLVCPALFDLGEQQRVVVMSVTEGEDKPLKYPHMFQSAQLMLLNKCDLLPHVQFDVERCLAYARQVSPDIEALSLSATSGEGMDAWYRWLLARHPHRQRGFSGPARANPAEGHPALA